MLEILAPAGNMECADAAIANGADAVYIGLESFSARQGAENFDVTSLEKLLEKARFCGVKVYAAMNTIVKSAELDGFFDNLLAAWNLGVDAVIIQDIFLGKAIKALYPEIVLHLSTQAGVCTVDGALLAKEYGFSRVILARETPLAEIEKIARVIETELFVQGALCTAFSGQCYFSSFVGGNSGNRGRCKQPCRKLYAYDRNGNEEKSYALSLSDLCVGESIDKLIAAGVASFKIEGRMRRAEYVGAAVKYYRARIADGCASAQNLSDLKRTYNRGNYTQGLAFGQDKRLLSIAIQGHVGEKVGVVKVIGGKFLVESSFSPQSGDAFKILRGGKEIGGASYLKKEGKAFVISSKQRLRNGDGVFVTTDTELNRRVLSARRQGRINVSLYFEVGKLPKASCNGFTLTGENPLQSAQNCPLRKEELIACFEKTDGLPVSVNFEDIRIVGDIFMAKSELNGFRRAFYAALSAQVRCGGRKQYAYSPSTLPTFGGSNGKTAVIADDFTDISADIAIYKPKDFSAPLPETFLKGGFERYLYYPPFLTKDDLLCLEKLCRDGAIDGVYAENYGGVSFARRTGVKLFAGTGFHLINSLSLQTLLAEENLSYYALSKEANAEEIKPLAGEKAFVLSTGEIKLMDLCYCPFEKTCKICDKRGEYTLTDENGRVFPVRRYLAADGSCRFEVYNCAALVGTGVKGAGKLIDLSIGKNKKELLNAIDDENEQKELYTRYTSGHFKRGVL